MTDYVATRWYRAPEMLLSSPNYSTKIDMWSFGCIVGELIKGTPLFPGNSTLNQIDLILRVFPPATKEDILTIKSNFTNSILSKYRPREIKTSEIKSFIGPNLNDESMALLFHTLRFSPSKRYSAADTLEHSYFKMYRNKDQEMLLNYDLLPPIRDDYNSGMEEYRRVLFDGSKIKELKCERLPHNRPNTVAGKETNPQLNPNGLVEMLGRFLRL